MSSARQPPHSLETRTGRSHVIVVAPHGGRRVRNIRRSDSVNDLHTAEIARELAERIDASAFINTQIDRNDTDLNRISDLARDYPGLLASLRQTADDVLGSGGTPLFVFVHGWNMVVPSCDVGVGLQCRDGAVTGRYPTVSRRTFERTVEPLMQALRDAGLGAALGLRYPASGKDNALQMFSGRHRRHSNSDIAYLSRLALDDKVDAIQLELGIPLRWSGKRRDTLVETLAEVLGERYGRESTGEAGASGIDEKAAGTPAARAGWTVPASKRLEHDTRRLEEGYNLQAVLDDRDGVGVGLFAGVESTGPSSMACRICLVRTDGSMSLFVAEDDWAGETGCYRSHGLDWRVFAPNGSMAVSYDGPVVTYAGHDAYEDLERGLAGARLQEAEVSLEFTGGADAFGMLKYNISIGAILYRGTCAAVLDRGSRRGQRPGSRARVFITRGLAVPRRLSGIDEISFVARDDGSPAGIRLSDATGPIGDGVITACVPVWRPLPGGGAARFTFGLASFDLADRRRGPAAYGVYDRLEVFDASCGL